MEKEVRLIDANEFHNRLKNTVYDTPTDFGYTPCLVKTVLEQTKTVDAVEVVHGRMVEVTPDAECPWYKVWECSLCGNRGDVWYNYCPNCGAKMRGDSE